LVRDPHPGVVLNEHYDGDGAIIFREACNPLYRSAHEKWHRKG
jgi:hypothetical protein